MFEREPFPMAVHIAAGVAVGGFLAGVALFEFWQWRIIRTAEQAASDLKASVIAAQGEEARRADQALIAEVKRRTASASEAALIQRAIEQQKRDALELESQREQAWARFYQKPVRCDEARGGAWTVDCANDFIRAKKLFAEKHPQVQVLP